MSPKKSAVVPALFAFGPPVTSLCLSLYYPKASKLAFAHPRDHKSRGGATHSPARSYVVVVAVTSILATCRALGIFYKNNLTRFLQEQQQQQQQCLTESTLSRLPCKCRPHRRHHRELPLPLFPSSSTSSSASLCCSSSHTLTCCRIPQMLPIRGCFYCHCCLLSSLAFISTHSLSLSVFLPPIVLLLVVFFSSPALN